MKIQFLNGGLANQTFQYIFARYYELSHPGETMYLDDSYFALNTVHNGYELNKVFPDIHVHMLSECYDKESWSYILKERTKGKSIPQILSEHGTPICMVSEASNYSEFNPFDGKIFPIPCNQYLPEILDLPGDIYFHGYWINKCWFEQFQNSFLKELSFSPLEDTQNRDWEKKIQSVPSVSLHIRRGDYVPLGLAFQAESYKHLTNLFLEQMSKEWEIFIFSDDINWCKQNHHELGLDSFKKAHFIEGNIHGKNYIDLQLMSQCKAMILSNSAFCYLAALLNTNKQFVLNPTQRTI